MQCISPTFKFRYWGVTLVEGVHVTMLMLVHEEAWDDPPTTPTHLPLSSCLTPESFFFLRGREKLPVPDLFSICGLNFRLMTILASRKRIFFLHARYAGNTVQVIFIVSFSFLGERKSRYKHWTRSLIHWHWSRVTLRTSWPHYTRCATYLFNCSYYIVSPRGIPRAHAPPAVQDTHEGNPVAWNDDAGNWYGGFQVSKTWYSYSQKSLTLLLFEGDWYPPNSWTSISKTPCPYEVVMMTKNQGRTLVDFYHSWSLA